MILNQNSQDHSSVIHLRLMQVQFRLIFYKIEKLQKIMLAGENTIPFIPIQAAANLYTKWDCQTVLKQHQQIYYKCIEGNGSVQMKNGNFYTGNFLNGMMNGEGEFIWASGIKYKGSFQLNKITGKGKFTWLDGSSYDGGVLNGFRHGYGIFVSTKQNCVYEGQWKDGFKQGKGKMVYNNGKSSYQGQFSRDKRNGRGKMIYPSSNQYDGEWKNNKKEGYGVMNWFSVHERYLGNWKNDEPEGYGQYYWFDNKVQYKILKNVFKGEWKQGKRNGLGAFFYSNGCKFEGNYKNNLKQGIGISFDEFGFVKVEKFSNDKAQSLLKKCLLKKFQLTQENQIIDLTYPKQIKTNNNNNKTSQRFQPTSSSINKQNLGGQPVRNIEYKKYIDFQHAEINENFHNFMLRLNTRFRNLYKQLSQSSAEVKQFYSGMTFQNFWKALKDAKILNENVTLVKICKEFCKGTRSYFQVIAPNIDVFEALSKHEKQIVETNEELILWEDYVEQILKIQLDWENLTVNQEAKLALIKKKNICKSDQIILFRHFVCLIIHTSIISQGQSLKQKVEKTIQLLEESLDLTKNTGEKQKTLDNMTYQSTLKQIIVPQWTKNFHQQILHIVCPEYIDLLGRIEKSVPVRTLFNIFQQINIFKDSIDNILSLDKVDKYLNLRTVWFKKEWKGYFGDMEKIVKEHPSFGYLMNYELSQKQIAEFIFVNLNRKSTAPNQQQFKTKYKLIIEKIISYVSGKKESEKKTKLIQNKKVITKKDEEKVKLLEEQEERKRKIAEEKRIKEELQREEKERELMTLEDHDVEDIQNQSDYSSEYFA